MIKKILSILGAFIALVLAAFIFSDPLTGERQSDALHFIGRFHPVVLHVPIGFIVILAILEFASLFPIASKLKASTHIILVFTILATLLAVFTGMILAYASGSAEPLVVFHMRASLILGILCIGLGILKLYGDNLFNTLAYRVVLIATLGVLFVASHNGGSITHGEDYLTKYMPNSLKPMFGQEVETKAIVASVNDLNVYKDVVHQVFEQNCNSCHNPDKKKGELTMETYEGLLKGGDTGYSIAPGDRDDSELYFRITLPHDAEDFMPTDGKPPLGDIEVELVGWWIDQGADPEKTVGSYADIPPPIFAYFKKTFEAMVSEEELEVLEQQRQELYANLASLRKTLGVLIIPMETDASEFSVETFAVQKTFDDQALMELEPFAHKLVEADFSNTQLTDKALATLAKFENLRSLNLSKTRIEGQSIDQLAKLRHLESLNLYGTPFSAERVAELSKLTQLNNLYLFQTELYDDTVIAQLREALPGCNFVLN